MFNLAGKDYFTDQGHCRPLIDFKDFDWKNATDEDRMECALAPVGEAGMSHNELRAILLGLNTFGTMPLVTVETGLGYGYSTRIFLTHCAKYGGEHHIFESFPTPRPVVETLKEIGLWKYATLHPGDARHAEWPLGKIINFLNIDSEHSMGFVTSEYHRFRMCLTHNSVVGFHDTDCCDGVRRGIQVLKEVDRLLLLCDESRQAGAGYQLFQFKGHDRCDSNYYKRLTDNSYPNGDYYKDEGTDSLETSGHKDSIRIKTPFREAADALSNM